jgi:hypothetical protein
MAASNLHTAGPCCRGNQLAGRPGLFALALVASCGQTLDAGYNESRLLPVSEHNPVILLNDSVHDQWSAEYAALFASQGRPHLAGIIVNATPYAPDLEANLAGWREFALAARAGGLRGIPDPIGSPAAQLVVPPNRQIASTKRNDSAGARLILRKSAELSLPGQPLVVVCGAALTDIADAYLLDPSVAARVVVVAQLGSYAAPRAAMSAPNGDLDPWADWIVAQYFTYVQISIPYDQGTDLTADELDKLPPNPFVAWMSAKRARLANASGPADHGAILAVAAPGFVTSAVRSTADTSAGFNVPRGQGPPLVPDENGNAWLVTQIDGTAARSQIWAKLNAVAGALR